jgi:hypothetical protein
LIERANSANVISSRQHLACVRASNHCFLKSIEINDNPGTQISLCFLTSLAAELATSTTLLISPKAWARKPRRAVTTPF